MDFYIFVFLCECFKLKIRVAFGKQNPIVI